jgi:acetoin utilization protein AcuB
MTSNEPGLDRHAGDLFFLFVETGEGVRVLESATVGTSETEGATRERPRRALLTPAGLRIARLPCMERAAVPVVGDYMTPGPYLVAPNDFLPDASALMRKEGIRHLPVLTERGLVGILSDRDLNLVQTLAHARSEEVTVEDAMTPDPYVVQANDPLNQVARVMIERKIGSAVVLDGQDLVGIFTVTDALQALVEALEGTYSRRTYESVTTEPPAPRHPSDLR